MSTTTAAWRQPKAAYADTELSAIKLSSEDGPVDDGASGVRVGEVGNPAVSDEVGNSAVSDEVGNPAVSDEVGNSAVSDEVGNPAVSDEVGNPVVSGEVGNPLSRTVIFQPRLRCVAHYINNEENPLVRSWSRIT